MEKASRISKVPPVRRVNVFQYITFIVKPCEVGLIPVFSGCVLDGGRDHRKGIGVK